MLRDELEEIGLGRFVAWTAVVSFALSMLIALLHRAAPDLVRSGPGVWQNSLQAAAIALAYLGLAGAAARGRREQLAALVPLGCLVVAGLVVLSSVRVVGEPSWDYSCYLRAGQQIRHGGNIYLLHGYQYLYSPALAALFSTVEVLPLDQQGSVSFWVWQVANYWAAMLFMLLLAAALRRYRVAGPFFWPLVAVVMVANVPLQRTLITSQVNLHVANLVLGYVLLSARRPVLSGGLLGVAAVLKTSPALLVLLPAMERRGKVLLGVALGAGAMVAISVAVAGVGPWRDCLPALLDARSHGLYRDNSVQSLLLATGKAVGLGSDNAVCLVTAQVLTVAAVLGLVWWASQPRYRALFAPPRDGLVLGALPYLLVAMVVASPLIWEHHWVFLQLPFCLLVARAWHTRFALPALLSYGLVYLVPVFDVYPLSYHRLAGLIWWALLAHAMVRSGAGQSVAPAPSRREVKKAPVRAREA